MEKAFQKDHSFLPKINVQDQINSFENSPAAHQLLKKQRWFCIRQTKWIILWKCLSLSINTSGAHMTNQPSDSINPTPYICAEAQWQGGGW